MSILIKGMEMPDSCFHCKLAEVCKHYKAEHYANKRHEDCPLEEVPSAQPETHDKRTETHACDLIDRQVAIDTLDKHLRTTDVPVSYPGIISALTEWLNELPSAQPEPCKDAVKREDVQSIAEKSDWFESSDSFNDFMWALYELPSAQPDMSEYSDKLWKKAYERGKAEAQAEIVRCKDCIFHGLCRISPKWAVAPKDDWYCADAERSTDERCD